MSRLFDLSEIKEKENKVDRVTATRYFESQNKMVSRVEQELDLLPEDGESFDIITLKSFNAFSLILWVLNHTPYLKKLTITTYSLSRDVSDAIFRLYNDGKVKELTIILSDSMVYRNPFVVDNVKAQAKGNSGIKVILGWNHTKISLMETAENRFLVITGSGNFSKNAQYENYIVRSNENLYNFYLDWTQNMVSK